MKAIYHIYALSSESEPLQVRYIGRTTRRLQTRLVSHLGEARRGKKTWLSEWIRNTTAAKVKINLLGTYDGNYDDWDAETKWIGFYLNYCDLLNKSSGCSFPYRQ